MSEDLIARVQDLIENTINPAVAGHGGFVQLVDVKDNRSVCRWAPAAWGQLRHAQHRAEIGIYSGTGERLARLGQCRAGLELGQFISPHGLAVDSRGDIYVGDVSFTN